MHILYIHQHFGTPLGSAGTRSYEFARRLIAAGHRVTMVCGASGRSGTTLTTPFVRGRRDGIVDGIEVIEYNIGYSTSDGLWTRIRKFTRFGMSSSRIALTSKYDIIFATSTPLTAAIPGILARWIRRKPFVFEVRDLWPELPRALGVRNPLLLAGMSALEWLGYHSAHRLVGLAPGIVSGMVKRGIPQERVSLIPNGCDLELFGSERLGGDPFSFIPDRIAKADFTCVYSGAHGIANALDALVEVAAELKRRGRSDIKLLLIGSGATKADLQQEVRRRNLEHIVVFAEGIPKTKLAPLLREADAGLQILKNVPAFYEGTSPNKFFDYLAAGIPVIVNYPGWIAELVRQHDCGAAVAPGNPAAFADLLEAAADAKGEWKKKGINSRRLAETQFDRDALAQAFQEVIETAEAWAGPGGSASQLAAKQQKR